MEEGCLGNLGSFSPLNRNCLLESEPHSNMFPRFTRLPSLNNTRAIKFDALRQTPYRTQRTIDTPAYCSSTTPACA